MPPVPRLSWMVLLALPTPASLFYWPVHKLAGMVAITGGTKEGNAAGTAGHTALISIQWPRFTRDILAARRQEDVWKRKDCRTLVLC